MERDAEIANVKLTDKISTHTLTWSVTLSLLIVKTIVNISTHTLTWSVTHFNPV